MRTWLKLGRKQSSTDQLRNGWSEKYDTEQSRYIAAAEKRQREFDEQEAFCQDFESACRESRIDQALIDQYLRFNNCTPRYMRTVGYGNPRLAWRMHAIGFRRYFRDSYGHKAQIYALERWLKKRVVVTPEQSSAIENKGYDLARFATTRYMINLGGRCGRWVGFQPEEFSKKELVNNKTLIAAAIAILMRENQSARDQRRLYEWD